MSTQNLQSFIFSYGVLSSMAGVTIAFSTGTLIRSFVGDIVLPSIYKLLNKTPLDKAISFIPIKSTNIDNFVKELVQWVLVVIFTYIFIKYVMERYVSITPVPKPTNQPSPVPALDKASY